MEDRQVATITRETDPKTDDKHLAYKILAEAGMGKNKAAEILGYSKKSVGSLNRAVEAKGHSGLLTPKRIKKAYKVIDQFMDGKGIGTVEIVKDSTVLQAAKMVVDRADPVQQEAGSGSMSFVTINLGQFETRPEIDVTPQDVVIGQVVSDGP